MIFLNCSGRAAEYPNQETLHQKIVWLAEDQGTENLDIQFYSLAFSIVIHFIILLVCLLIAWS